MLRNIPSLMAPRRLGAAYAPFARFDLCVSATYPHRSARVTQKALCTARRNYIGSTLVTNLAAHSTQLASCTSLPTLLYSPLGTAMLLLLAYNVVVVISKNVNYVLELTAKDYVQDQQLYVIMRYGILSCILLGMEVMFIEV